VQFCAGGAPARRAGPSGVAMKLRQRLGLSTGSRARKNRKTSAEGKTDRSLRESPPNRAHSERVTAPMAPRGALPELGPVGTRTSPPAVPDPPARFSSASVRLAPQARLWAITAISPTSAIETTERLPTRPVQQSRQFRPPEYESPPPLPSSSATAPATPVLHCDDAKRAGPHGSHKDSGGKSVLAYW
jgi:hypothetical protein